MQGEVSYKKIIESLNSQEKTIERIKQLHSEESKILENLSKAIDSVDKNSISIWDTILTPPLRILISMAIGLVLSVIVCLLYIMLS